MIQEAAVWAIFLLPLGSFVAIALLIRPFLNRFSQLAALTTITTIGASFALSLMALGSVIENGEVFFTPHEWLALGSLQINLGIILDPLTAIMLVVVTGVSLMVQVYSLGYMKGDPGFARYYALMSLFTASMIGLVIASNVVQLYVFWELVGVCSYLLIGFWFTRPAAAAAAKKAFIVTRIGDLGFLIAILYLFFNTSAFAENGLNALEIADISAGVQLGLIAGTALTLMVMGIFAGAAGKSAQFPLHIWLPDAMEGPTPVSALIHAATMVAAGVFLIARFFPVVEASVDAMQIIAVVGAVTAIFAATMGLVMNDIKRVLAYSTISQLGYMVAALGVGAYVPAIFHLFTHAFFKALLFMGAGSVNHASGTFDMRYMGGLRKYMPWTYVLVIIGSLSLAGIFPLSGFWSKDEILAHAWTGGSTVDMVVFWLLFAAVPMTAFYIFRMVFMTFHGEFRGGVEAEEQNAGTASPDAGHSVHLAESPWVMVLPMGLLAVASVVVGGLVNPVVGILGIPAHWFADFLGGKSDVIFLLAVISIAVAVLGICVAAFLFIVPNLLPGLLGAPFRAVHNLLARKYYMDELFEGAVTRRGFYGVVCGTLDWIDRKIVDNFAETIGWSSRNFGRVVALLQTGQAQGYVVVVTLGAIVIGGVFFAFMRI